MMYPDPIPAPAPTPSSQFRQHRPLLPVVTAFCVAILAADGSAAHPLWAAATVTMLAGGCVALGMRYAGMRRPLLAAACMLVLGYAYTLWSAVGLPADHVLYHLSPTPVALEGQVLRLAKVAPNRTTLDVSARTLGTATAMVSVSGRVRVTAYDFDPAVQTGDSVRLRHLRLRQPRGFRNPGAFDYGRYLARRGIYATGSLSKPEQIEVVQHSSSVLLHRFTQLKSHLAGWIAAAMGTEEAAITTAMALGVRGALPPQVREAFNASGTVHLLSVSGFHVAAVYGAAFFLLRFLIKQLRFRLLAPVSGGPRPSKLAAIGALAVVMGYACLVTLDGLVDLVDPNFPAIRSTVMIATFVFAYLMDRDGDPFNIALLAALLILALDPFALFGIGFQLSFVGVLAIFYVYRFLPPARIEATEPTPSPSLVPRLKRWLRDAVIVSTFASLATTPLIMYHFERLPLIAPLANIVVAPFASIAVPSAIIASFTTQTLPFVGSVLLSLTAVIVQSMYGVIRFFAAIPYAAPYIGAVPLPTVVLAYAALLLLPYSRRHRIARWGGVGGAMIVILWLAWPWLFPAGRGQLLVTFLDVGHGDASVIRFPHGSTMLIDSGGSFRDDIDIGARVVAPFLRHIRVYRLDYLVATHPQSDHAKGFSAILRDFAVGQFWDNGEPLRSEWYRALRDAAVQRGIYRDVAAARERATVIDGVHLDLLHPSPTNHPQTNRRGNREDAGENNRSLVLKLTYGAVSFLFTGDIEQEAESELLQTGDHLRATVLKVPHHGSLTSSSEPFVRAVDPRIAVVSVQPDSRFGHPHPRVIERYRALGVHVFRTDGHGAITVRTDGQSLSVEPHVGKPLMYSAPMTREVVEGDGPAAADLTGMRAIHAAHGAKASRERPPDRAR
jgi:competence protein ComEC